MARLRQLRHHPVILADDSRARGVLAIAAGLAIPRASSSLDWNVDSGRLDHGSVAKPVALQNRVDMGAGCPSLRRGTPDIQTLGRGL